MYIFLKISVGHRSANWNGIKNIISTVQGTAKFQA